MAYHYTKGINHVMHEYNQLPINIYTLKYSNLFTKLIRRHENDYI